MRPHEGLTRSEINTKIEELAAEGNRLVHVRTDLHIHSEDYDSLLVAKKEAALAGQLLAITRETTALEAELFLKDREEGVCDPYQASAERVENRILSMTKEVEVGDVFTGRVVMTTVAGAFVKLKEGVDGFIHVSKLEHVLERGDTVTVEVVESDGIRIELSLLKPPEVG